MSNKAIGIDLGSTLSEICVIENGKPTVIVNEEGSKTTPSVVYINGSERKIGGSAKRQMLTSPKNTVNLIKRFMGATYDESQEAIKHVRYDVVNNNNKPYVKIDDREYSAEEISSMILTKLKKTAEDYLGEEVKDAVITVPAFFSDSAKAATKMAGELAGLNVLRIIAEPTAAILSSNIDMKKDGKYMVADFGGSTLDLSVADISDNVVEILASYGDVYLGGSDLDNAIANYFVESFKEDNGVDISTDAMAMSRIVEAAEKAKIELTSSTSTDINLPYITAKNGTPLHLTMSLNRAKFEQIIKPFVDRVVECGKTALEKAKINSSGLDGILLIGGSCRIPLVQKELEDTFNTKLIKSSNLDLAVAEGAAIQANILSGDSSSDILLLDVCPLAIGLETMGNTFTKVVEENTTIPCKRSQIFTTAVDNQPAVTLNILNGVRPLAKDNKSLGTFTLDGIAPARRGVPQIEVTFDIDANSILTVTALDKATGKEQHITIENSNSLSQDEIDKIKADAEAHKKEDELAKQELEKANKCDSAIYQTENLLDSFKDNAALTDEDKTYFNGKLDELKKIKENKEYSNLDTLITEVNEHWSSVSAKAYASQQGNNNGSTSSNPFANMNNGDFADVFNQFTQGANAQNNSSTTSTNSNNVTDFEEVK
jgi:molecular chaperone DnaK